MAIVADIRYDLETQVEDSITNEQVVRWCNEAQAEFLLTIEKPTTTTIAVNTTDMMYNLPANFKRMGKLYLQSDMDAGVFLPINKQFDLYNGKIRFISPFGRDDTLNMDYYRNLTVYTATTDTLDLEDQFKPLYTSFSQAQYYDLPRVKSVIGDARAEKEYNKHMGRYAMFKEQISGYYASQSLPGQITGVW